MNRFRTRVGALTTSGGDSSCSLAHRDRVRYFPARSRFAFLPGVVALVLPIAAHPQSLDDAVQSQLEVRDFVPCAQLRDGQPNPDSYLTGPLLAICKRGGGSAGTTPAVSTGGGAATPTALPSIVQQRLREVRREDKRTATVKPTAKVTAASADADAEGGTQWGLFMAAEKGDLGRDVTSLEDGYDSTLERLVVGLDLQASPQWVAGMAFDASRQRGDFDGGGDFEVKSYGIVGFGLFMPTDKTFVQFYGGLARESHDRDRNGVFTDLQPDGSPLVPPTASGIQAADYDADQYRAGVLLGYDQPVGHITISPRAGLDWTRTSFDTYTEKGTSGLELTFRDDDRTSLQASLGAQVLFAVRAGAWEVLPQAGVHWKHEFKDHQRTVEVSFAGDMRAKPFSYLAERPDGNWVEVNAGLIAIGPSGLQIFGNYHTMVGHRIFDSHAVTIGLRVPF